MVRFIVRRLLLLIPILFGVSVLLFFWVRALPGSPAESLLGERATPELVKEYNERFGLDDPVYVQYWKYVKTTAQFDFGVSSATHRYVTDEIKERFPATVELAVGAMIFAVSFGILLLALAVRPAGLFGR
jgi:peptide/nickel transport system permease protein